MAPASKPAITIRAAQPADVEGVSLLLAESQLVPLTEDAQFGPQYAVALCGDAIIGIAGIEVHGQDGLLRSVCLHPQFRSLRIGAALVEDRIDWARAQGLRGLYLLTETASEYWPRFGFERIAREDAPAGIAASHEWKSACPSGSTAMRLLF